MSKKQTLSNTNYSSPDWLTIREAVEVINKKGLKIKKKVTFTGMHYMAAFISLFTFSRQLHYEKYRDRATK